MTQRWEVEVRVDGESVLVIGSHLSGVSNIEDFADVVRQAGEHLLSFIGPAAPVLDPATCTLCRKRPHATGKSFCDECFALFADRAPKCAFANCVRPAMPGNRYCVECDAEIPF
jgi:hypothetical protein